MNSNTLLYYDRVVPLSMGLRCIVSDGRWQSRQLETSDTNWTEKRNGPEGAVRAFRNCMWCSFYSPILTLAVITTTCFVCIQLPWYDSSIVASAIEGQCGV